MILRAILRPRCMARRLQHPCALVHSAPKPGQAKRWSMHDLETLLAVPAWSVESLLPPTTPASNVPAVSAIQLHHLLRLSALPPPESPSHEAQMLNTLSAQLHFVGQMQQADTAHVKPLRAIRDETKIAEREQTITMDTMKEAFAKEKIVGKHYKRIQREPTPTDAAHAEDWPVMASAERSMARYFVVESERPQE